MDPHGNLIPANQNDRDAMTEREIFYHAIEIEDPVELSAYLEKACGGNHELRAKVDELLKSYEQASQFLETPISATDSTFERTVLSDTLAANETPDTNGGSGESEFLRFLEPATRSGWLGRLGHYEVEEILGRGACGIVAKGFDEKLHRVVAIKLMNPDLAVTSPPRKRFLREARTVAAVNHENIVNIYAVEENPIPYLVMEYVSGKTLEKRMDEQGPFEIPDILKIGQQISAGLAAAHAVKLIHRDIKPSNILLTDSPEERVKISDFGLARAVDDASMTSSGMIVGTPLYMAPEQARGETLDHRADLFSLGSVLYQMVSGRPPFRAPSVVGVLKRVCDDMPRPLEDVTPGIPAWLSTVVFRLLAKDRGDRYQTAQQVADLLARCHSEFHREGRVTSVNAATTGHEGVQPKPDRTDRSPRTRNVLRGILAGFLAIMAIGVVVLLNRGGERPAEVDASRVPDGVPPIKPDTPRAGPSTTPIPPANRRTLDDNRWDSLLGVGDDGLSEWQPVVVEGEERGVVPLKESGWDVVDGVLVCNSDRDGFLQTTDAFGNFRFEMEFRLPDAAACRLHFRSDPAADPMEVGMAIILENDGPQHKNAGHEYRPGAIEGVTRGNLQERVMRQPGEWNQLKLTCDDDHVEVWINGVKTVAANMESLPALRDRPRAGRFLIANWKGRASGAAFRNVRVRGVTW